MNTKFVSSWNTNKSSARYDFMRDMVQCQVDVAMFQETLNWHHEDGAAADVGWNLFHLEKMERRGIAVRKNMNLSKHARRSTRWVFIVQESILFLSLSLPHTWSGEVNLEEDCKSLRCRSPKFHISGISAGMDVQVEVKPHQEPSVGGGSSTYRGYNTKYWKMEAKFESLNEMDQ